MRPFFRALLLTAGSLLTAGAAQAQQTTPSGLSEDSVRVMSGLVESSVRQLRAIYFEPTDARSTALIEAALAEIPVRNQRLSHYTASLSREQQQLLAQRLRRQPWQVELNTLLRSPQYQNFDLRAAKNPELKAAADRLHASGFVGTGRPAAGGKAPASKLAAAATATPAAAATATAAAPAAGSGPAPKPAATPAAGRHTVQKGDTLYGIARQYHVSASQLREWNNKTDDGVKIGEVLVVQAAR
ncbi:LysM peptidoglycan-binding domain-containing protein [Hymenobacter sp. NST-14]|uniref:LysM peptidoglycan-binding domain-containing protein n=1 Tax=Hymenobacter piscis TaxID=2839984 RepID=UPI001C02EE1D|nr:LysM domain-containing protein [Hymenobacter piscis]MBT9391752.1 LysM peptidoglycan-binding domain-containing protein [Hymenobacter piscis]